MNRAARLLRIFDKLLSQPLVDTKQPHSTCRAYWATALGLDARPDGQNHDEIDLALIDYRTELDAVAAELTSRGVPGDLFKGQFKRIKNAASTDALSRHWRDHAGNVNPPDVRLSLAWAACYLPDDEAEVDAEELAGLAADLDRLEESLKGADKLPPIMQAFALKQLRTLRAALRSYPVKGIVALEEAVEAAAGAVQVANQRAKAAGETVETAEGRTVVEAINKALTTAVRVCADVDTVRKGGAAVLAAAEGFQELIGWAGS